jgi:hypothetical protein
LYELKSLKGINYFEIIFGYGLEYWFLILKIGLFFEIKENGELKFAATRVWQVQF